MGCGVYADDNVGAASATGDGDLMTNYCTSISIVHLMARGASPQDACMELLKHMVKTDPQNKEAEVAVIAINTRGEIGAACMNEGFHLKYALWRNDESQLLIGEAIGCQTDLVPSSTARKTSSIHTSTAPRGERAPHRFAGKM